jgi:predicted transposase/invertase (TIGR01784 family)
MIGSRFLDPKNDVAFKKIFGSEKNKDILIHFLNDILGFEGDGQVQDVRFLDPVQNPAIASQKQSIVDVLCTDKHGKQYIVEMQVEPAQGFEKRAQYYAAKAYCNQLNKGQEADGLYVNLKEIIFIAITAGTIFKDKPGYLSRHVILDKNTYAHDLKDFSFTFIELPKFKKKKIEDLENIVEKWCYFFKYAESTDKDQLAEIIKGDAVIQRAYEALDQFGWNQDELRAYEKEIKRIMDNRAVLNYKIEKAEARGRAEGEARGRAEGKNEEKIAMAKKMLAKGKDIEEIAEFTGLTKEEISEIPR